MSEVEVREALVEQLWGYRVHVVTPHDAHVVADRIVADALGPLLTAEREAGRADVQERLERCLRLRNADGTHKIPAEVRNIIRATTMDAPYESETP